MPVFAVPRESWEGFLRGFSRRHEGWLARVERDGAPTESSDGDRALDGVASRDGGARIEIRLRGEDAPVVVDRPSRVLVHESEGVEESLEIVGGDESATVLAFRSPTLTEMVDDATSSERAPGEDVPYKDVP